MLSSLHLPKTKKKAKKYVCRHLINEGADQNNEFLSGGIDIYVKGVVISFVSISAKNHI